MQKTWLHTFFAQYSRKFFFSFFILKAEGTGRGKAELGPPSNPSQATPRIHTAEKT